MVVRTRAKEGVLQEEIQTTDGKRRSKAVLGLFMANKLDALSLFLSVTVAVSTVYDGKEPVGAGRNSSVRMNALFLGILGIS